MVRMTSWTAGLAAMLLPVAAWADSSGAYGPYQHHGGMWYGGWGGMFLGPLMMVLVIGAVIFLVALAVRWVGGGNKGQSQQAGRSPLDILKERFARGEIDESEFDQRRRVLGD